MFASLELLLPWRKSKHDLSLHSEERGLRLRGPIIFYQEKSKFSDKIALSHRICKLSAEQYIYKHPQQLQPPQKNQSQK